MAIAPLSLEPPKAYSAFDFSPLAQLGQRMTPQNNTLSSLGQRYGSSVDPASPSASPALPDNPGGGNYANAIAGIESGGKYDLLGPTTGSGDRAYGKYQVMGNNIPDWTKAALGVSMTPEQFLQNPKAQDAVFQHRFGSYVQKYGPTGAAKAWFAGEGGMNNPDASDQLGTTVSSYARRFNLGAGIGD
jgi:hypothetical protein